MTTNVNQSINVLESFFKRTDAFGEEIKKMQEFYDDIQKRKAEYYKKEAMMMKEKNDLIGIESKMEGDLVSLIKSMHGFQKEAVSVATEMYKRAQAEAMYRAQAEAAQRGLAEAAHKVLSEAAQRAKAEADYRAQAEASQRQLIEQAERMQQEAAKRIQAEISKVGSYGYSGEKPPDTQTVKDQKTAEQAKPERQNNPPSLEDAEDTHDVDGAGKKKKMTLFK